MPDDVLHFSCQACETKLTVPVALAGIEGPCPKCGATIKAPEAPSAAPEPEPAVFRRPESLPEKRSTPAAPPAEQAPIRPEPRELPERPSRPVVSPRHSTSDVAKRPAPRAERPARAEAPTAGLGRFLIPVAFLFVGGTLAYALLWWFMGGPGSRLKQASLPPDVPPPAAPGGDTLRGADPVTVPPDTGPSDPGDDLPPPPPVDPAAEELEVQDILRDFLRASSLGARLPLVEPARGKETLVGSVIDTPLLSADQIAPEAPTRNTIENFVDHPFRVRFERDEAEPMDVLVIVRKRSEQKAKVLVDPLLDLLGGRLEAYAAAPVAEEGTFRAVIEAMLRCFEEGVPNPDDKITYKLTATTQGGEIARAYASKLSPLAEMLYSPDSELRWGKRMPATVTLKWNTTEAPGDDAGPGRPYLELIAIKSLDWSP